MVLTKCSLLESKKKIYIYLNKIKLKKINEGVSVSLHIDLFHCWNLPNEGFMKQGFHVARAEAPPHERNLASELRIAKMHNRQMFDI